jgi:hypothetical protein
MKRSSLSYGYKVLGHINVISSFYTSIGAQCIYIYIYMVFIIIWFITYYNIKFMVARYNTNQHLKVCILNVYK